MNVGKNIPGTNGMRPGVGMKNIPEKRTDSQEVWKHKAYGNDIVIWLGMFSC